ncbi:MAG: rubrerythrin family protein [Bacteroidetes bacterium]|nr:rubrerythrin family protein [Bacteroidota bacterium]
MKRVLLISSLMVSIVIFFSGCQPTPKPVKTIENLKVAFKGESNASAKYAAYAQKAREEGFPAIAVLFTAASEAEKIHAGNHAKVLEKLGVKPEEVKPEFQVLTTKENLQDAITGEGYEMETMYPGFLTVAEEEKANDAKTSFTFALDTEKKHHSFYVSAMAALEGGTLSSLPVAYYVCPKCGNTFDEANVKDPCDFCQTPKDKFKKFM